MIFLSKGLLGRPRPLAADARLVLLCKFFVGRVLKVTHSGWFTTVHLSLAT